MCIRDRKNRYREQTDFEELVFNNFTNELNKFKEDISKLLPCLLYTSPSPRDRTRSRMPSSAWKKKTKKNKKKKKKKIQKKKQKQKNTNNIRHEKT